MAFKKHTRSEKLSFFLTDREEKELTHTIAENVNATPFVLDKIYLESKDAGTGEHDYTKIEGIYFPVMSNTYLKSKLLESNLAMLINEKKIMFEEEVCALGQQDGGFNFKALGSKLKNTLGSVKEKLGTVKKSVKSAAHTVTDKISTKIQVGEKDCGNNLSGPSALRVNYLGTEKFNKESGTKNLYFAVLMYCNINMRTHVRFLGIMKIVQDKNETEQYSADGLFNPNTLIKNMKLYSEQPKLLEVKIQKIGKNKCWDDNKINEVIQKTTLLLNKLNAIKNKFPNPGNFLRQLVKSVKKDDSKTKGGARKTIALKNNEGISLLQRYPDTSPCVPVNYRNLGLQIWFKMYLNIMSSGDCGGKCKKDIDKRKGSKRRCGKVSREVEISDILPDVNGEVVYSWKDEGAVDPDEHVNVPAHSEQMHTFKIPKRPKVNTQMQRPTPPPHAAEQMTASTQELANQPLLPVGTQTGGELATGGAILVIALTILCCTATCNSGGASTNWFYSHICCNMCIDCIFALFD